MSRPKPLRKDEPEDVAPICAAFCRSAVADMCCVGIDGVNERRSVGGGCVKTEAGGAVERQREGGSGI